MSDGVISIDIMADDSDVKKARMSIDGLSGSATKSSSGFKTMAGAMALVQAGTAIFQKVASSLSGLTSEAMTASDSINKFQSTMEFAGKTKKETEQATVAMKKYADETVYDLNTVSNTTAQLAANGISNYTELTQAAGNLNSVAGGNAETFKSVAMMLTQTAGAGKLTTENWNQLTDAIPGASGRLQEAMLQAGAYTGNFRDAMAEGQITADEFSKAIMDLGMTDAAKQAAVSTATFEGAFGNLQAALVSAAAGILDYFKKPITDVVTYVSNAIPKMADVVKNAFQGMDFSFLTTMFENAKTSISNFVSNIDFNTIASGFESLKTSVADSIGGIVDTLGQYGSSIASAWGSIFDKLAPMAMESLTTVLGQLPDLFQSIVDKVTPIIDSISQAFTKMDFSGIQSLISNILPAIQAGFETFMNIVGPAIDSVVDSFVKMWNAAQPLIEVLSGALMPAFEVIGAFLGGVLKGILMGVGAAFDAVGIAIQILTPVVSWIVDLFKSFAPVLTTVAEWIGVAIGMFANMGSAGEGLSAIIKSAWSNIKNAVSTAGTLIKSAIDGIKNVFTTLGSSGNVLSNIMGSIWNAIKSAVNTAGNVIKSILSAIGSSFRALGDTFSSIGSKISGIIDRVKSTIQGLANIDISGAGAAIMNGFLGGLKSAYEKVKDFIGGIGSWIAEHKGPISYDRRLLIPAGKSIMDGFNKGLQNQFKQVQSTIQDITNSIAADFMPNITPSVNYPQLNLANIPSIESAIRLGYQEKPSSSTNNYYGQQASKDTDTILAAIASMNSRPIQTTIEIDSRKVAEATHKEMSRAIEKRNEMVARSQGIRTIKNYY